MSRRALVVSAVAAGLLLADVAPADATPKAASYVTESVVSATPENPAATGVAHRTVRSGRHEVTARSAAVTRTQCDGCSSHAVTLQVVVLRGTERVTVENVASAWSTCRDCASTSVSVQVVVAFRAEGVRAVNSAEAVNTDCVGCTTNALAFQFVLVTDSGREVAHAGNDLIRRVQAELAGVVPERAHPAADRVQSVVERALGGRVVDRHVGADTP
jgi:hypothetical protein